MSVGECPTFTKLLISTAKFDPIRYREGGTTAVLRVLGS
jgi:hypothetical protein